MRGKIIVPEGTYMNKEALENTLTYAYESDFACTEDALYSRVENTETLGEIIHDFKDMQKTVDMEDHHRAMHLVITIPVKKNAYTILYKISEEVIERFYDLGLQCMMMPHSGSLYDPYNMHIHLVINPIKIDGTRFYSTKANYHLIRDMFNECSRSVTFTVSYN